MKVKILSLFLLCLFDATTGFAQVTDLRDGVWLRTLTFEGGEAHLIRIRPGAAEIRVVSSRSVAYRATENTQYAQGSFLLDLVQQHRPLAIVSGGYLESFSPPRPLGFVKVSGDILSRPHESWLTSGIFCTNGREWILESFDGLAPTQIFADCLQAGPFLVLDGIDRYRDDVNFTIGEQRLAVAIQEQVFICIDHADNLILGYTTEVETWRFSDFLRRDLGCVNALRLSGSTTAGFWTESEGLHGNNRILLTNAIAILE